MTSSDPFAKPSSESGSSDIFRQLLEDHQHCMQSLLSLQDTIGAAATLMQNTLQQQGRILVCGNGGSAADAQHFAAELVGRFEAERPALAAISLTTDSSILTALANDYDFRQVFARQVEALGSRNDVLLTISTSGNSPNLLAAVEAARSRRLKTIGLLGRQGGSLKAVVDISVTVSHTVTARIQEAHSFILHYWALRLESAFLSSQVRGEIGKKSCPHF